MNTTSTLTASPSCGNELSAAFSDYLKSQDQKPPNERIRDQALTPYYMSRGALGSAFGILKSLWSPVQTLKNSWNLLKDPGLLKTQGLKKLGTAKTSVEDFSKDPISGLQHLGGALKNKLCGEAVDFLRADHQEQSERMGALAPHLVLMILSGKFPVALSRAAKLPGGLTFKKFPLGMKNAGEFRQYSDWILDQTREILKPGKDLKAFSGIRGSSVSGVRHHGGTFGPKSDYDFFVVSDELYLEGRRRGARGRKGMLFVGDTLKYFKKDLAEVEKKISSEVAKNQGTKRQATIRIFSQKGFEQIAQGPGKELIKKTGTLDWLRQDLKNWWESLLK